MRHLILAAVAAACGCSPPAATDDYRTSSPPEVYDTVAKAKPAPAAVQTPWGLMSAADYAELCRLKSRPNEAKTPQTVPEYVPSVIEPQKAKMGGTMGKGR